jgi:Transposase DDE domain group 1
MQTSTPYRSEPIYAWAASPVADTCPFGACCVYTSARAPTNRELQIRLRRRLAKVEHHLGELFPRVGFIVTNLGLPSRAVVGFYNKRGTAEQWIKEGNQAVKMTRVSCHRFRSNEMRLWLSLIAYDLGNLWRRLVLPKKIENWSLTSLQQRLVKTGGRLIKHARYYWLLLAEGHLTRRVFAGILRRIRAPPLPAG